MLPCWQLPEQLRRARLLDLDPATMFDGGLYSQEDQKALGLRKLMQGDADARRDVREAEHDAESFVTSEYGIGTLRDGEDLAACS